MKGQDALSTKLITILALSQATKKKGSGEIQFCQKDMKLKGVRRPEGKNKGKG